MGSTPREGTGSTPREGDGELRLSASTPVLDRLPLDLSAMKGRSGETTPVGTLSRFAARQGATTPRQVANNKAENESALLAANRRQIESFEERIAAQLTRMKAENDRIRDVAITRLEEKISQHETQAPTVQRRIAELAGSFKGLSDEMQKQIGRVDSMERSVFQWRQSIDEEFRQKHNEMDQSIAKVQSSTKVLTEANHDMHQRHNQKLQRLEREVGERFEAVQETKTGLSHAHARLDAVDNHLQDTQAANMQTARLNAGNSQAEYASLFGELERRQQEIVSRVDELSQDAQDVHERLQGQDERTRNFRTLHESQQVQIQSLGEKVLATNWGQRLDQLQKTVMENQKGRAENQQQLELMAKRLEHQELAHDDLRNVHDGLLRAASGRDRIHDDDEAISPGGGSAAVAAAVESLASQLDQLQVRVQMQLDENKEKIEAQDVKIQAQQGEMSSVRDIVELGPRVNELIMSLRDIVPKVIEHDAKFKELSGQELSTMPNGERGSNEEDIARLIDVSSRNEKMAVDVKTQLDLLREEINNQKLQSSPRGSSRSLAIGGPVDPAKLVVKIIGATGLNKLNHVTSDQLLCTCEVKYPAGRDEDSPMRSPRSPRNKGDKFQTKAIGKTLEPEWNEEFIFEAWQEGNGLEFSVLDKGMLGSKVQGSCMLTAENFRSGAGFERELDFADCPGAKLRVRVELRSNDMQSRVSQEPANVERLQSLELEVAQLRGRIDDMPNKGGLEHHAQLVELVKSVQNDEAEESDEHRRLLTRIDELCSRLAAVDAAVAAGNGGMVGGSVPAAELVNQFETLADRVEDSEKRCRDLQFQIQDKFCELSKTVERFARIGAAAAPINTPPRRGAEQEDQYRYST